MVYYHLRQVFEHLDRVQVRVPEIEHSTPLLNPHGLTKYFRSELQVLWLDRRMCILARLTYLSADFDANTKSITEFVNTGKRFPCWVFYLADCKAACRTFGSAYCFNGWLANTYQILLSPHAHDDPE